MSPAAIVLPVPCAGSDIAGVDFPCARDASVVVYGAVVLPSGQAANAWVFVCPSHSRPARRMLQASTPAPEEIDAMSLDTFMHVQRLGIFDDAGVDAPRLSWAS